MGTKKKGMIDSRRSCCVCYTSYSLDAFARLFDFCACACCLPHPSSLPLTSPPSHPPTQEASSTIIMLSNDDDDDVQHQAPPVPPSPELPTTTAALPSTRLGSVRAGTLNAFFTCSLCEGYLRDPYLLVCCFSRRYCKDCLIRNLRQQESRCPNAACQAYLGAKLSMLGRPDVQLKDMMLKLLPEVFAQERQREGAFYQARESDYPSPAPTQTLLPTTRAPAWQTRPRDTPLGQDMFVLCLPAEGSEEAGAAAAEATAGVAQESSALPALQLPYLKVQRRMQVLHLRRVLVAALGLADELDPEEVDVLCKGEVLTGQHSLYFIEKTKWAQERPPLILQYRRKATL